ncbi:MAG: tRNA pseudouridine(55) synthase TruB [Acidobacteria bacterium]|nr:MAG: tRNA pseudouridine(55) synthase TruB [Acidobacteriota bacterium]
MNGVLLIDKPSGPTSHDVVARIRNTAKERSVGHTGTLDPMATGLLPLVMGKATRLAPYFSGSEKTYIAEVRLGFETSSDDAQGEALGREFQGSWPSALEVQAAVEKFRGSFEQVPPQVSAKRVEGKKSYDLARQDKGVELRPVQVHVSSLTVLGCSGAQVRFEVTASAGFYVRALARDLGRALGCGGHLAALRRTKSGAFDVANALPLDEAERLGPGVEAHLISPADALADFPAVTANAAGFKRATHGNALAPEHLAGRFVPTTVTGQKVRILAEGGSLIALADSRGGELHPAVVLAERGDFKVPGA